MMTADESQSLEQRRQALEQAYAKGATCSHPADPSTGCCLACHQSVCDQCAFPLSECQYICLGCIDTLKESQETRIVDSEEGLGSATILNQLPKTPFTLVFTAFLAILYAVSAYPGLSEARSSFLDHVSLDLKQIVGYGEFWRLVTGNFFHANLGHLGTNAIALLLFGHLTERRVGVKVMLLWMLAAMVGCDLFTMAFIPNGQSIGVSGIAIGLETAIVMLTGRLILARGTQNRGETLRSLVGFVVLIVLVNVIAEQHINVFGHLGGALAGLICALVYPVKRPFATRDVWAIIGLTAVFTILLTATLAFYSTMIT